MWIKKKRVEFFSLASSKVFTFAPWSTQTQNFKYIIFKFFIIFTIRITPLQMRHKWVLMTKEKNFGKGKWTNGEFVETISTLNYTNIILSCRIHAYIFLFKYNFPSLLASAHTEIPMLIYSTIFLCYFYWFFSFFTISCPKPCIYTKSHKGTSSVSEVEMVLVTFTWSHGGIHVFLCGSFDGYFSFFSITWWFSKVHSTCLMLCAY